MESNVIPAVVGNVERSLVRLVFPVAYLEYLCHLLAGCRWRGAVGHGNLLLARHARLGIELHVNQVCRAQFHGRRYHVVVGVVAAAVYVFQRTIALVVEPCVLVVVHILHAEEGELQLRRFHAERQSVDTEEYGLLCHGSLVPAAVCHGAVCVLQLLVPPQLHLRHRGDGVAQEVLRRGLEADLGLLPAVGIRSDGEVFGSLRTVGGSHFHDLHVVDVQRELVGGARAVHGEMTVEVLRRDEGHVDSLRVVVLGHVHRRHHLRGHGGGFRLVAEYDAHLLGERSRTGQRVHRDAVYVVGFQTHPREHEIVVGSVFRRVCVDGASVGVKLPCHVVIVAVDYREQGERRLVVERLHVWQRCVFAEGQRVRRVAVADCSAIERGNGVSVGRQGLGGELFGECRRRDALSHGAAVARYVV